MRKILIVISWLAFDIAESNMPMSPGTTFMPTVIESARDMMWLYPSTATLVLAKLSAQEEQEIIDLIQDKSRVYLTIKRDITVAKSNWKLVGTKKAFGIWQLHIKSPDAVRMQAFFYQASLPPELKIKVYSGQRAVTSHVGEYLGDGSQDKKDFWSTSVPGHTIVIEVWVPQDSHIEPQTFPFEIKSINHYFREKFGDVPDLEHFYSSQQRQQSTCSVYNNLCINDGQNAYRAISLLEYTEPDGKTTQCTGSFLNSYPRNKEYYLLTAFHCIYPGSSENMRKGSDINAQITTSFSPCANTSLFNYDRLVGDDIKFIAGNEAADWALLWVDKSTLQRADGLNFPGANAPYLLGWSPSRLTVNSQLEILHHSGGFSQSYARFEMLGLWHDTTATQELSTHFFVPCQDITGCSHYRLEAIQGGIAGGASGSPMWDFEINRSYRVRAVYTHGRNCSIWATRFDKLYEDGRVQCALVNGDSYYPGGTSTCNDSARSIYYNLPRLATLKLSYSSGARHDIVLSPNFDNTQTEYTVNTPIASYIKQVSVAATANDNTHIISANGRQITRDVTVPLDVGGNTITVTVSTSDSSKTTRYTIYLTRASPYLSNLSLSSGTLNHAFNKATTQYTTTVGNGIGQVSLTAIADDALAQPPDGTPHTMTATINGRAVNLADPIPLNVENNTIVVTVTTADNKATVSYTVEVTRLSPCLTSLSLSSGIISPNFIRQGDRCGDETVTYKAIVANDVSQINVIATADSNLHTVTFNNSQSAAIPLNIGDNEIAIRVATADGKAMEDYNLTVRRLSTAILTNITVETTLQAVTLKPSFSSTVLNYIANLNSDASDITVIPTASDGSTINIRYTPEGSTGINQSVLSGEGISMTLLPDSTNIIYIDVTHNGAMEQYILRIQFGISIRAKVFLEGPL